jgi:hypothetical protein
LLEANARFDTNVLCAVLDLLGWLQLDREVCFLAAIYLLQFDASTTFPKSHNVWQQFLVALKLAQIYLYDEPYPAATWTRAIPHLTKNSVGQVTLESDVLVDAHIHLHIDQKEWKLLNSKFTHISTLLLTWFDDGKFVSENAKMRI